MNAVNVVRLVQDILANNGPGGLDLQERDLAYIDLSGPSLEEALGSPESPQIWRTIRLGRAGINLVGANLSRASLPHSNLCYSRMQLVCLSNADLYGANLEGADLYRADLRGATLYKADLNRAKLERADLSGADLQSANLTGANLLRARLDGALLSRSSIGARLIQEDEKAYAAYVDDDGKLHDFALALASQPEASREHLYMLYGNPRVKSDYEIRTCKLHVDTRYIEARDIYRSLKACFEAQSLSGDASWAHFRAMRMQRLSYLPSRSRACYPERWRDARGRLGAVVLWMSFALRWVGNAVFEWICGYGERPARTVVSIIFLYLVGAIGIQCTGQFEMEQSSLGFADSLIYSLAALTGLVFGDLNPVNPLAKVITGLEGVLGVALFALLMFSVGNRLGRG